MDPALQLRNACYNDPECRAALNELVQEVFGFSFAPWNDLGLEFEEYTPFTLFEGRRAVANVSASPMALTLAGRELTAIQIGTVCSRPQMCRRGLIRELMLKAHEYWDDRSDFQYLFADETVLEFYQQFGYRPVEQHRFFSPAPAVSAFAPPSRMLSLAVPGELEFLRDLADRRASISRRCGIRRQAWIWLFHAAVAHSEGLMLVEDLDVVVIRHVENDCLHLIDVMGRTVPTLAELYPYIGEPGVERIEFHFSPELMAPVGLTAESNPAAGLFVRGAALLPTDPFCFPGTAEA